MGAPRYVTAHVDAWVHPSVTHLLDAAEKCAGDPAVVLAALASVDATQLQPGSGHTADRLSVLAAIARADVTAGRVVEPHLDALAILAEAATAGHAEEPNRTADAAQTEAFAHGMESDAGETWGVFAAEAPGARLDAVVENDGWVLSGEKPWCSLGTHLSHALVTAHTGDSSRRLFRVALRQTGVHPVDRSWVARGLAGVPSGPLRFDHAAAVPVGGDEWYLKRPGFAWGGMGVAACWWGGAIPVLQAVLHAARTADDARMLARAGHAARLLETGRIVLDDAARRIDEEPATADATLAHIVRGAVADAVDDVVQSAEDVLGPGVFAFDEAIARRCADLRMYVMQRRRGRDDASIARRLAAAQNAAVQSAAGQSAW